MSTKNIVLGLLAVIAMVLFYTWQRMEVLRVSYEIDRLRNEKSELSNKNKFLQVEVASMESLDRVEKTSREQLGLVTPEKFEMIALEGEVEDSEMRNFGYGLTGIKSKKGNSTKRSGADTLE